MRHIRHILTASFIAAAIAASAQSPRKLDYSLAIPGDAKAMDVDASGNTFVAGTFSGNETFGPFTLNSSGFEDIFVLKINTAGVITNAVSFGGDLNEVINSLDVDANGSVYLAGNFSGNVDFDPGSGSVGLDPFNDADGYLLKLDANLNYQWVATIAGFGFDDIAGVVADQGNSVYFTGTFNTDATINYKNTTADLIGDNTSAFFAKISSNGNRGGWEKVLSNDNTVYGTGVATDFNGAPVFVGYYYGTVNLDPDNDITDVTAKGQQDIFLLKLNPGNGTYTWSGSIGGDGDEDYSRSIYIDQQNGIYVTGKFYGTGDFDPGSGTKTLTSNGYSDIFVTRFNNGGGLVWAHSFGAQDLDEGLDIYSTGTDVYVTGNFFDEVDFGTSASHVMQSYGPYNDVSSDAFILNLDANGNFKWVGQMGGSSFDSGVKVSGYNDAVIVTGGFKNSDNDMDPSCVRLQLDYEQADSYVIKIGTATADCIIITKQPAGSNEACINQQVVLSVEATGAGISYQWMTNDGDGGIEDVEDAPGYFSGANTSKLTVFTGNDYQGTGVYYVVLTRGQEELTSSAAYVSVGPQIPYVSDVVNCGPGSVKLTAYGGANGIYRWYTTATGGSPISGVTNDTYTTPSLTTTTSYWVSIRVDNCESQRVKITANITACEPPPALKWAKTVGATSTDDGGNMIVLKDGNLLVPGSFAGTIDFGLGASTTFTANGTDGYLLKMTPDGNVIWVKVFTGASSAYPGIVKEDDQGNIYMSGSITGTSATDFDGNAGVLNISGSNATYSDAFVVKYDKDGNALWGTKMGNPTNYDYVYAMEADATGVYLTGDFWNTFTVNANTITSLGGTDIFILKLSTTGTVTWLKQLGNNYANGNVLTDYPQAMRLKGNDLYLAVPVRNGLFDVDPGIGIQNLSTFDSDACLIKLNTNGDYQSAFKYTSLDGTSSIVDIVIDKNDNIYLSGDFYNTNDFDPASGTFSMTGTGGLINNSPSPNGYVAKHKSDGSLIWAKQFAAGFLGSAHGGIMTVADNGDVIVSGSFQNSFDADPGDLEYMIQGSDLLFNSFVIKLNNSGEFNWGFDLARYDNQTSPNIALGSSHVVDAAGDIYMTGSMAGRIDFDPSDCRSLVQAVGATDFFIWKLSFGIANICFDIMPQSSETCAGDVLTLTASATGAPGITYQWQKQNATQLFENINDDANYSGTKSSELKINSKGGFGDGNYRVIASAPKAADKTSDVGGLVFLGTKPNAPTTTNAASCLATADLELKAAGGTQGNYRWYDSPKGGSPYQITGDTFQTGEIDETTTYYVAISDGTCDSNRTPVIASIDVANNPPMSTDGIRCGVGSVTLVANGANDGQYRWYLPTKGSPISGQTGSTYTTPSLSTTTSYFVSIALADCESPLAEVVAIINAPQKPTAVSKGTCINTSVELTATAASGEIRWYSASTGGTPIYVGSPFTTPVLQSTTSYYVSNYVGDCESERTEVKVTVGDCTNNKAPVITTKKANVSVGGILVFDLKPLLSDPDDNLDLSTLKVIKQPNSKAVASIEGTNLIVNYTGNSFHGEESVTIEVCDIAGSCTQQDITIEVSAEIVVYNAVSPNGDGKNDVLYLEFIDTFEDTKSNHVTIYNRWGDVVFEVDDYDNVNKVFAGKNKNGNDLSSGTYYYKIQFHSSRKSETGYLSLKR